MSTGRPGRHLQGRGPGSCPSPLPAVWSPHCTHTWNTHMPVCRLSCSLHSMVCVHPRMFSQASSLQSLAFAGTTQGSGLCCVWSTGAEPGMDTAIRARHWAECEMTLPDIPLLWHRAAHPSLAAAWAYVFPQSIWLAFQPSPWGDSCLFSHHPCYNFQGSQRLHLCTSAVWGH